MMTRTAALLSLSLLLCSAASAATPVPAPVPPAKPDGVAAPTAIVDHAPLVVSGALPGPGLWKVRKDGHTMYVLATLSPLPRRMEWESDGVASVVARSQLVLLPPSFTLGSDVGMFRGLMLVPSLLKARRNPEGRSLQEVVPAPLYARWSPLKQRYLGGDRGVERWRPIFAAQELYEAAMRRSGLSRADVVDKEVRRLAKHHALPMRAVNFSLQVDDPKGAIREFQATTLGDTDCFARTLSRIETDLEAMRLRANAWATGDVQALRALPMDSQYGACVDALTGSGLAQRLGVADLRPRLERMWLDAAAETLARHETSLALLPLALVTGEDGYLAALAARGYVIEAPEPPAAATAEG